jgi:hypothetical protein
MRLFKESPMIINDDSADYFASFPYMKVDDIRTYNAMYPMLRLTYHPHPLPYLYPITIPPYPYF